MITRTILLAGALMTIASCNSDANSGKGDTSMSAAGKDAHAHSYRCPMNCEKGKTYEKPGKCPVCGMTLEHYDGGEDNGLTYQMQFKSEPASLQPGQPAVFSFTPKVEGKEGESVALDLQHEKKIHLIVVSDDLSYFEHIHPEYQADGSYQIKVTSKADNYSDGSGKHETTFQNGGDYFLFADYKPTGGAHQVEKIPLKVGGTVKPTVKFGADKLSGTSGNYSVSLKASGGKLVAGSPLQIAGSVLKEGKEIDATTLEDYLGAKAHMVVISLEDKEYLHVHPGVVNGKFELNTTFKQPGVYRGWIQFQSEGKVHTVDFTMNVAAGSANAAQSGATSETREIAPSNP